MKREYHYHHIPWYMNQGFYLLDRRENRVHEDYWKIIKLLFIDGNMSKKWIPRALVD